MRRTAWHIGNLTTAVSRQPSSIENKDKCVKLYLNKNQLLFI